MAGAPSLGDSYWEWVGVHNIYFFIWYLAWSGVGGAAGIYLERRYGLSNQAHKFGVSPIEEKGKIFTVLIGGWGLKEVGSSEGRVHLVSEMYKAGY